MASIQRDLVMMTEILKMSADNYSCLPSAHKWRSLPSFVSPTLQPGSAMPKHRIGFNLALVSLCRQPKSPKQQNPIDRDAFPPSSPPPTNSLNNRDIPPIVESRMELHKKVFVFERLGGDYIFLRGGDVISRIGCDLISLLSPHFFMLMLTALFLTCISNKVRYFALGGPYIFESCSHAS